MPQSRLVYDHTETSHGDGSRKEAITSHGMQDKESEGTLHDKANGKEEGPDNGGQSDAGYKRVNQALGARRPLVTRMDHDHNDVDDNTETDDEIPTKPTRRSDRRFGTKRAITLTMDHPSNNSMDDGDYHDSEEGEEEEEDTDTDEELPRRRKRIADTRIHLLVEQAKENKKIVSTKAQDMSNSNNTTHLAGPAQGIGTGSCSQRRSVPTGSSSGDNKNNSSRTSTGTSDCNNHLGRLVQEIIVDTLHRDPYIQEAARMLGITGRQEEEEEEEDHQAAVQSVYHRKKQQPIFQFMILDQDFDNWLQYHSDEISCQFIRKRREREIKQSRRQGQVTYEHRCHKQGSAPVKPQGSKNTRSSKKSNCKSTITSCTMDMIPTCPPRSSTSTTTTTTTTTAGRENARDQHRQGHVVIKVRRIRYNYCHNHPLKRPENLRDMRKSPLLRNKIQRLVERGKTIQQVLELLAPESQDVVSVDPSTSDTSSSSDSNKNHPPSSNAPLKRDNVVTYDDVYHVYYKALRTLSQKADDDRESCRLWMAELEGQGYLTFHDYNGSSNSSSSSSSSSSRNREEGVYGFASPWQLDLLKLYGNVFCLGGTHDIGRNKTQLYTIVVKHDRGFGIPVAYLLTKKSDLQVLSGWLKKLAMRMGESFKPSVIVTDQGSVEMKAIKSAFSQCKIVFCTGHTLRSWKQNHHERGVSTTEREKIQKDLSAIIHQLDPGRAQAAVQKFRTDYGHHSQLIEYVERRWFARDRAMWMQGGGGGGGGGGGDHHHHHHHHHRPGLYHAQVPSNQSIEAWYDIIDHPLFKQTRASRFDRMIYSLSHQATPFFFQQTCLEPPSACSSALSLPLPLSSSSSSSSAPTFIRMGVSKPNTVNLSMLGSPEYGFHQPQPPSSSNGLGTTTEAAIEAIQAHMDQVAMGVATTTATVVAEPPPVHGTIGLGAGQSGGSGGGNVTQEYIGSNQDLVQNVVSVLKTINVGALLQVEEERQQQAAAARSLKRSREQFEPLSDRVEASARQGPSS